LNQLKNSSIDWQGDILLSSFFFDCQYQRVYSFTLDKRKDVTSGNDDVAKETEIKKGFFYEQKEMVLVFPLPHFPVVILIVVNIVFLNSTNIEQTSPLLRCNSLKGTYNSVLPAAALSYWLANPRTFPYCRAIA
jgi:hypothetical protein